MTKLDWIIRDNIIKQFKMLEPKVTLKYIRRIKKKRIKI